MIYARTFLLASLIPSALANAQASFFETNTDCSGNADVTATITTTCQQLTGQAALYLSGAVTWGPNTTIYTAYEYVSDRIDIVVEPATEAGRTSCESSLDGIAGAGAPTAGSCIATGGGGSAMFELVPPSPPPGGQPDSDDPCFHSSSICTLANGTTTRVDALKEGDAIIAATAEGDLTIDTVTLLSIAKPEAEATFVVLVTDAGEKLTLTGGHHLPVGESCCSALKKADHIAVGDKVWAAGSGAKAVARTVATKGVQKSNGLHSPVLMQGGFPVVDGVVTSFDSIDKVTLAKYGLAPLLAACKATGTCDSLRDTFFGEDKKYLA